MTTTTSIQLKGLTCVSCQKLTSKRIKTIQDVEDVTVELSGETTIKASRIISEEEVSKALVSTHYSVVKEK